MSFFDDVLVNTKSVADVVGKKAEDMIDYSRLKMLETDILKDLSKKYEALGSYVYQQIKNDTFNKESLNDMIEDIGFLESQLNNVRNNLERTKNKKICSICGKNNANNASYCSYCGADLKK